MYKLYKFLIVMFYLFFIKIVPLENTSCYSFGFKEKKMFYSHTLLARKTPLGTVWCAAHLQHRLNKKDYEKTKIPVVVG